MRNRAKHYKMVRNAFCPTGEGGGVDPSCSPGETGFTTEAYHGSKLPSFDMKYHMAGRGGYRYWTASEDHARGYAGEKGTLIKGNLRIKNPIDLMKESGPDDISGDRVKTILKDKGVDVEGIEFRSNAPMWRQVQADGLKYRLRDAGYDAIIISEKGGDKSYFIMEDDQIYRKKSPTTNARTVKKAKRASPLRFDPTRTTTLRRAFIARLRRGFARLRLAVVDLIARQDALGLREVRRMTGNAFCPTGEGGGVDPSCSPSEAADLSSIASMTKGEFADKYWFHGQDEDDIHFGKQEIHGGVTKSFAESAVYAGLVYGKTKGQVRIVPHSVLSPKQSKRIGTTGSGHKIIDSLKDAPVKSLSITIPTTETNPHEYLVKKALASGMSVPDRVLKDYPHLKRPTSNERWRVTGNAFCPTGLGGGQDNSCSGKEGGMLHPNDLPTSERGQLRYYADTSALPVNKLLRGESLNPQGPDEETVRENIEILDRVLSKSKTDRTISVHRKSATYDDVTVGQVIHEPGFLSTFRDAKGKSGDARGTMAVIIVPRGVGAIDLNTKDNPVSDRHWEREILLQRGLSLKVTRISQARVKGQYGEDDWDKKIVHMTVVKNPPTTNERWRFHSDPDKLKQFQDWLKTQIKAFLVGMTEEELWRRYVEEGFKKGAGRAFEDVKPRVWGTPAQAEFYAGSKDQFLKSAFGRPESVSKVKLLASRSFDEMKGMTEDMTLKMGRALVDGLTQGKNPNDIARDLSNQIGLSRNRAETIARTEIIRAHAEGQLQAFEEMGVDEIGVMVEWTVTEDEALCPLCEAMQGVVLKIEEARGMIPRHPNCRCAFIPANVGEATDDQTRGKKGIVSAVKISARMGRDGFDTAVPVSKVRPTAHVPVTVNKYARRLSQSVKNAFCPTGVGGGVDPSCGKGDSVVSEDRGHGGLHHVKAMKDGKEIGRMSLVRRDGEDSVRETGLASTMTVEIVVLGKEHRGKGIGKSMYRAAMETAKKAGARYLVSDRTLSADAAKIWDSIEASMSSAGRRYVDLSKQTNSGRRPTPPVPVTTNVRQFSWLLRNAFCATGVGGGIDNTCSPFANSAMDFGQDVSAVYKNAPLQRVTDEDVEKVKLALKSRGQLNKDGTISLYHDTLDDPEGVASILKYGLIPAAQKAPGQTWEATHSSHSTYFHQDKEAARGLSDTAEEEFLTTIEARIPVTKEFLQRVIPDEESGDVHEGISQLISGSGAPTVIGGVPAKYLSSKKYGDSKSSESLPRLVEKPQPRPQKRIKTEPVTIPGHGVSPEIVEQVKKIAKELSAKKYKGKVPLYGRVNTELYRRSNKSIATSGWQIEQVLKAEGITTNLLVRQFSSLLRSR